MAILREIKSVYKTRSIAEIEKEDVILDSPAKVAKLFTALYGDVTEEHFIVFMLNTKNKMIAHALISKGTVNQTLIHAREIFKLAVLSNAVNFICAHNHPSGDLTASEEDKQCTERLNGCGDLMGIKLLDHVIVNTENKTFCSLREEHFKLFIKK